MELGINISNGWALVAWSNYVELAYRSSNPIVKIDILLWGKQLASYALPGKLEWGYRWAFNVPSGLTWNHTLTVKAVDDQFYSKTISKWVVLGWKDVSAPTISLQNPARWSINLDAGQSFNLRATISDTSSLRAVNVYFNGKTVAAQLTTRNVVVPISTAWLPKWTYTAKIDATDMQFNTSSQVITVNVISWDAPKVEDKVETEPKVVEVIEEPTPPPVEIIEEIKEETVELIWEAKVEPVPEVKTESQPVEVIWENKEETELSE